MEPLQENIAPQNEFGGILEHSNALVDLLEGGGLQKLSWALVSS